MKNLLIVAGACAFLVACSSPKANTEAEEAVEVEEVADAASEYVVNGAESTLAWKGSKVTGDFHTGTANISMGKLSIENNAVVGGEFVIDMASISVSDEGMDDESKGKLAGHLTSPDFFDVETNKTASFEVGSGTADSLTGNLTMKGVTKAITIPYTMTAEENNASFSSSFSIDRTQWGVEYGSSSLINGLGDKAINDVIEFDVTRAASK